LSLKFSRSSITQENNIGIGYLLPHIPRRLGAVHARIGAGGGESSGLGAILDDATVRHHQDATGDARQPQAVGDDDGAVIAGSCVLLQERFWV